MHTFYRRVNHRITDVSNSAQLAYFGSCFIKEEKLQNASPTKYTRRLCFRSSAPGTGRSPQGSRARPPRPPPQSTARDCSLPAWEVCGSVARSKLLRLLAVSRSVRCSVPSRGRLALPTSQSPGSACGPHSRQHKVHQATTAPASLSHPLLQDAVVLDWERDRVLLAGARGARHGSPSSALWPLSCH